MPFQEQSVMQSRQRLARLVLEGSISVSEAARQYGVSRTTAYLWVNRAREDGIATLMERSRRPRGIPRVTPLDVEEAVLAEKGKHRAWGAKKLHVTLWQDSAAPVCVRTVDRILKRNGLVGRQASLSQGDQRFERERCNELWQLDYKGVPRRYRYWPLSVLDDRSRFLLLLAAQPHKTTEVVFEALWNLFGEVGLPDSILSDNGDGFNDWQSKGPTRFEANLWLLGISTLHGRARHPQTQGKVERFHETLKLELGEQLGQANLETAQKVFADYQNDYNWVRPHEALGMRVPGVVYESSAKPRPDKMPAHQIPEGAVTRKVELSGAITYRGIRYRAGKGLTHEWVEVRPEDNDNAIYFANVRIASLSEAMV
ncbi:MAG TPA: IS481 family transposase [Armatimonadota bacterium]|jgi:transposase InsO family protein